MTDACVIGGGPAGLAAAIALKQAGLEAMVVDCAVPPIDKACGEGLLPDSVDVLGELGIPVPAGAGFRLRGIRFCSGRGSVRAEFPHGFGVAMRRTVLHTLLRQRAEELGVDLRWGVKDARLADDGVRVGGQKLKPGLIVGADGQNSAVRRQAGLDEVTREKRRYGFRRRYRMAPWSRYVEVHWGGKRQLYVTSVAAGEVSVALLSREADLRLDEALAEFPEVASRLKDAPVISKEQGALSVSRRLKRVVSGNVALVGDASGSVDAITGEGMCLAFRQGLALARAVSTGGLEMYEAQHAQLSLRTRAMERVLLAMDAHPGVQTAALAGLAHWPGVFRALLAVHVGASPFSGESVRQMREGEA